MTDVGDEVCVQGMQGGLVNGKNQGGSFSPPCSGAHELGAMTEGVFLPCFDRCDSVANPGFICSSGTARVDAALSSFESSSPVGLF